jgi:hypothetical protein
VKVSESNGTWSGVEVSSTIALIMKILNSLHNNSATNPTACDPTDVRATFLLVTFFLPESSIPKSPPEIPQSPSKLMAGQNICCQLYQSIPAWVHHCKKFF